MKERYELRDLYGRGGYVEFDWDKDVEAVRPSYENTVVILKSGRSYSLKGRNYGV